MHLKLILLLGAACFISPAVSMIVTRNELSDSSSSDEHVISRLEARIHRCVRFASPGLVVPVSGFTELAKVEICAMEGMTMLFTGVSAEEANRAIQTCMASKTFPESVAVGATLFTSCVQRALQ